MTPGWSDPRATYGVTPMIWTYEMLVERYLEYCKLNRLEPNYSYKQLMARPKLYYPGLIRVGHNAKWFGPTDQVCPSSLPDRYDSMGRPVFYKPSPSLFQRFLSWLKSQLFKN